MSTPMRSAPTRRRVPDVMSVLFPSVIDPRNRPHRDTPPNPCQAARTPPIRTIAPSAGFARAILASGGGSEERAEGERRASEGGRSPPPRLLHGAGRQSGDVVVEEEDV